MMMMIMMMMMMMMVLGSLGTSPWFADNQVKDGYRNEDNKYEKN